MGQHGPESPQGLGRHPHPELRDVPLQVRANEVEPPAGAGRVAPGGEGIGEATAYPERLAPISDLQGIQTGQLLVDDAPRQRLRRLPEQRIRSRPEEEKLPGAAALTAALVNLAPEHPKETGDPLDLVQDRQPPGVKLQIPHRVRETGGIAGILEIEVEAVRCLRRNLARKRGLADLARTEEGHRRVLPQALQDASFGSPFKHAC